MKVRNFAIAVAIVGLVGALTATPARADQLTLGGDGSATFSGTGSATGDVITITAFGTAGGCPAGAYCIGSDSSGAFESPTGQNIFSGASWSFTVPNSGTSLSLLAPAIAGSTYSYAVDQNGGQTASFVFSGGSGDTVTGTINWNSLVQTGSVSAALNGTLSITSVTGGGTDGSIFASDFASGSTTNIDYTFSMDGALSSLIGQTRFVIGTASSGEAPSVPEPSTMAMLAMGLLAVGLAGAFLRRGSVYTA